MTATILVTGATGVQGGSTARELLARKFKVHALVRDPTSSAARDLESLGAVLFKGHFDDVEAIAAATAGVQGVFINTFPNFEDPGAEVRYAQNFVTAAHAAKTVTSVVVSTVTPPSQDPEKWKASESKYPFLSFYYSQKRGVEEVVSNAGFQNYTILQPAWLYYNCFPPTSKYHFPGYGADHVLATSYPRGFKIATFDPVDVGKFAAAAFADPNTFSGRKIELTNKSYTIDEIALLLTQASGVEIKAKYRSDEETQAIVASGKMPTIDAQLWAKEGYSEWENEPLDKYGFKLRSFAEYMEKEKPRLLTYLGVGK